MATLTITVNYFKQAFVFAPSYQVGTELWTHVIAPDAGGIAFIQDGQYKLKSPDNTTIKLFQFDAVKVVLGSQICEFKSQTCGGAPFDLATITFPVIPTEASSVSVAWQWCQALSADQVPIYQDPKLGLTNSRTITPAGAPAFDPCTCTV
jgi:hypothetical protein